MEMSCMQLQSFSIQEYLPRRSSASLRRYRPRPSVPRNSVPLRFRGRGLCLLCDHLRRTKKRIARNVVSGSSCSDVNMGHHEPRHRSVLLLVPNIIGYLRLSLVVLALLAGHFGRAWLVFYLFLLNFTLDGLDGLLARRLKQTSAFGAWLDVTIDNLSRGVLWAWALPGPYAAFPIAVEFLTFVATHKGGGAAWKGAGVFANAPAWVQTVMQNNFKTPAGALAVAGLMGMPLWLWARKELSGSFIASYQVGAILVLGRLVASSVELWVLSKHIEGLLLEH